MLRHLGLIGVYACIAAGVGCGLTDPDPLPPSPPPPPSLDLVAVEFGGRVVNAETGDPVANVRVTFDSYSAPIEPLLPEKTATSGGDGTFSLALSLPSDWRAVRLEFTGPAGYDDRGARFERTTAADRPAIRMYPTLVIRPGESIEVRVDDSVEQCGWAGEAGPCRRVLVAASPGDRVELELVPDDSSKPMGLSTDSWGDAPASRLMVPPGSSPYLVGGGTARLTARR